MRIYSSLSPLDLHARGAEICRAILARDDSTRSAFGQRELSPLFTSDQPSRSQLTPSILEIPIDWDSLHTFIQGPSIAPLDTANFSHYDDYSLWHHALMCYLQLCVRYPAFKDSKVSFHRLVRLRCLYPRLTCSLADRTGSAYHRLS